MTRFYHFCKVCCNRLFRILYKTEVYGTENLPKSGGYIVAANHKSFLDPPLVGITVDKQLFFMAKQDLFKNKLFGKFLSKLGAFPVSKGTGEQAIQTAVEVLNNGNVLGIFPEGTRVRTDELGRFKSGVIVIAGQTKADVVPAAVYYEKRKFRRKRAVINYGKLIKNSDLGLDLTKPRTIRNASTMIKNEIEQLREEIKCK